MEIQFIALSTKEKINEYFEILMKEGRRKFIHELDFKNGNSAKKSLSDYISWVKNETTKEYDELDFKCVFSIPKDDKQKIILEERTAIVFIPYYDDERSSIEEYYTLGFEPSTFRTPLRFRNSEISSRALIAEIRRSY